MVTLDALNRALRHVHRELDAVGLLHGRLDSIDVELAYWPSGVFGELGFVFDRGVGCLAALAGFRAGTIYLPFNAPVSRRRGETLRDVLRHEYAHALAWLEPSFVSGAWFRRAFGAGYDEAWDDAPTFDRGQHVTVYAATSSKEDFSETFCVWLRETNAPRTQAPRRSRVLEAKMASVSDAVHARGRRSRAHVDTRRGPRSVALIQSVARPAPIEPR